MLARVIRSKDIDKLLSIGNLWGLQSINSAGDHINLCEVEVKVLLSSIIRKFQFDGDATLRRDAAIKAVLEGEIACRKFNTRHYKAVEKDITQHGSVFFHAKAFCSRVLGDYLPDSSQVTKTARHGPGATTSTSRGKCSTYHKYAEWPYHVTARCVTHARSMIKSDERWLGALEDSYRSRNNIAPWAILDWDRFWENVFEVVSSNRITTVGKDCLKDRPIAIEPTLNVYLQLGVDGFIRRRLKAWGLNLDSQDKNRLLAREGSIDTSSDSPVTIDLSNASDTISLRIAKLLLPEDWYEYLCDIRSPRGVLPDGSTIRYRKLSSMGNGATFAIESLIFASIVYGVSKTVLGRWDRERIAVYGDDIIVPSCMQYELTHYLELSGFSVNRDKSFLQGPVRESCGADWYRGHMVRGVFLKEYPQVVPDLFADYNRLRGWFHQHKFVDEFDSVKQLYLRIIPRHFWDTCVGPPSCEDYSSYRHSDQYSIDQDGLIPVIRLSVTPLIHNGKEFLFRKIMHNLRSAIPHPWDNAPCTGSRFLPTLRNKVKRSVTLTRVPRWIAGYYPL
jgi:hypothetical protein